MKIYSQLNKLYNKVIMSWISGNLKKEKERVGRVLLNNKPDECFGIKLLVAIQGFFIF